MSGFSFNQVSFRMNDIVRYLLFKSKICIHNTVCTPVVLRVRLAAEARLELADATERVGQGATEEPLRILLCPDKKNWSFDNIATSITKFAGANRVHKLYMGDAIRNERIFFETIFLNRIDLCHVFWREDLFYMLHPKTIDRAAGQMGLEYESLVRAINTCAFTTSVYDHLFASHEEIQERRSSFALVDGYTVSSRKLYQIYSSEAGIPPPDAIIPDGVDTGRFFPRPNERACHAGSEDMRFRIGWVGNSVWGKQSQGYDVKGYTRLFQPMIAELEARGLKVEARVADPQVKHIPFEDMPEFYSDLDVFVCTSAMEGTPNPVLEAMASGIPVVSTDVGIVFEAFGDKQKRFMFRDPSPQALASAVAELIADENLRASLCEENRTRIGEWAWEERARVWWPFWRSALRHAADNRNATRRESFLIAMAAIL